MSGVTSRDVIELKLDPPKSFRRSTNENFSNEKTQPLGILVACGGVRERLPIKSRMVFGICVRSVIGNRQRKGKTTLMRLDEHLLHL